MEGLPSGDVTFVFTDVEGSTALFHAFGDEYLSLLADHNRLIREAVQRHGGAEVRTEGDSFFVAFADPAAAVAACVDAQLALDAHDWPPRAEVSVRIGMHTGPAHVVADDYVGLAVHEAARIASAGHGEQILLSERTASLVDGRLPEDVTTRDLGPHALKDFPRPQTIHQVCHPSLGVTFPALRTLTATDHNLPAPPTPLVGREVELRRIAELLLGEVRLVTLTGPGGIGKTRLALEAGWSLLAYFRDGVWFASLQALTDPERLLAATAETLAIPERPGVTPTQRLVEHLSGGPALLVLDNLEQVAEGSDALADLLAACPDLKILATSRERLRLRAEHTFDVPALDVPMSSRHELETLLGFEAVDLFVRRAQAVMGSFDPLPEDASALGSVVRDLEGVPLAIELAAVRIHDLGLDGVRDGLEGSLDLLSEGDRDLPPRQRTMRAAIAWSYELLSPEERTVLTRLAVFSGGASEDAALAVCGDDARAALGSLCARSLLRPIDGEDGVRYTMLETIRAFAAEHLAESERITQRHVEWFAALAAEADDALIGPDQARWLRRLEADHDNLRAALDRSDPDRALELAANLIRFWTARGHLTEGSERLEQALSAAEPDAPNRARALLGLGNIARLLGDVDRARVMLEDCLAQTGDDPALRGGALIQLGEAEALAGEADRAATLYGDARRVLEAAGDVRGVAQASLSAGALAARMGRWDDAQPSFEQAAALAAEVGDERIRAFAEQNLAVVHMNTGRLEHAASLCEEVLGRFEALHMDRPVAATLSTLGAIRLHLGEAEEAERLLTRARTLLEELGDRAQLAEVLGNLARLQHEVHKDRVAAHALWSRGLALWELIGNEERAGRFAATLGRLQLEEANPAGAERLFRRCLRSRPTRDDAVEGYVLSQLAQAALATGDAERAARLLGAAQARSGEQAEGTAEVRAALTEEVYATAFREGQRDVEEILDRLRRPPQ